MLLLAAVLVLATLLVTYLIVRIISKRLWEYGILYYMGINALSLVFSVIAVNNGFIRINGSSEDILILYLGLVGGFVLLSILVGIMVNLFWKEKFP